MDQNPVSSSAPVKPAAPAADGAAPAAATPEPVEVTPEAEATVASAMAPAPEVLASIAEKINDAHNVLVALSSNPTVDEMAAAIGLSLYLDKLGKRATAIYSGTTPDALEFLKPEETFELSADALQDFVIAISKDKADHLRYKLDGDYVKIFITPYKAKVAQQDLSFSYGDFNVDLVLALNVANGIDLDAALREHGRIMHDAVIINITTGNPGKLGEIEWSDKNASSVSEMVARLVYEVDKDKLEKEDATALLTGIVAATNRFSNAKTTPAAMQVSSYLMQAGANQQLVARNITADVDNQMISFKNSEPAGAGEAEKANEAVVADAADKKETAVVEETPQAEVDASKFEIEHADDTVVATGDQTDGGQEILTQNNESEDATEESAGQTLEDSTELNVQAESSEPEMPQVAAAEVSAEAQAAEPENVAMDDLNAAAADLARMGMETVPGGDQAAEQTESKEAPAEMSSAPVETTTPDVASIDVTSMPNEPASESESTVAATTAAEDMSAKMPEKVLQPLDDFNPDSIDEETNKYGQMLEAALASPITVENPHPDLPPVVPTSPAPSTNPVPNPAMVAAPTVASTPEINGVPEMNFTPPADAEILPPPPTPPIDMNAPLPTPPEVTVPAPTEPMLDNPVVVQPTAAPSAEPANPGSFQIPGV